MLRLKITHTWALLTCLMASLTFGCGDLLRKNGSKTVRKNGQNAEETVNAEEFEGKGQTLEELEDDGIDEVMNPALVDTGVGFRNFDQINQSYSSLTGVPSDNPVVAQAFLDLRGSLPFKPTVATITPGQVSAYTKLAAFYCDEAAKDQGLRSAIFGNLDFNAAPAQAFQNPAPVVASVVNRFFRPDYAGLAEAAPDLAEIESLVQEILVGKTDTSAVAMGLCTAVLSSAGVTLY